MRPNVCACCGQPVPETRLGLKWPPLKIRILDVIKRAGPNGIDADDLFQLALADRGVQRKLLYVHIWQINDRLEDVGYRIAGRPYRLVKTSDDFDPQADAWDSVAEAYRAIRERQAAGGPGWEPK